MSGHSKWHNIQERKGKQDAKRGNMFTKYAKAITIAAQQGGGNIDMNFSLRIAVEKAKVGGMPKDNIDRAIKRGTGELGEGNQVEEVYYEGYGPSGIAILIKALSDNKNRTVSDIKHMLSQSGGSMGGVGSVMWMFEKWGMIEIAKSKFQISNITNDELQLMLIEVGAEDFIEENEVVEIKTKVENLQKVLSKLKELGIETVESGIIFEAKDKNKVDDATRHKLENLFNEFEEHDDVDDYYTNAE